MMNIELESIFLKDLKSFNFTMKYPNDSNETVCVFPFFCSYSVWQNQIKNNNNDSSNKCSFGKK